VCRAAEVMLFSMPGCVCVYACVNQRASIVRSGNKEKLWSAAGAARAGFGVVSSRARLPRGARATRLVGRMKQAVDACGPGHQVAPER
jgi:hypothetical protein